MAFIRRQKAKFTYHELDEDEFVHDTLVDAEMVIDHAGNEQIPRLLIYDLIRFQVISKNEYY